ncbi:TrmH family RNA methyltransferase [Candidatus Nomurabacteria bacterium]|nr:TrmH family RNA methyltransferase [Candidatus Nomurabacteria bacterium]
MESIVLVLCDIRSNENVGSLLRTADAAGINKVYLCGITPAPIDRFGRPVSAITKTALGAEQTVAWEKPIDTLILLGNLKRYGYQIIAIEQSEKSVDYKTVSSTALVAFVLGNEVKGLTPEVLMLANTIAEIPMRGTKESLNVAVAGGVALFRILNV